MSSLLPLVSPSSSYQNQLLPLVSTESSSQLLDAPMPSPQAFTAAWNPLLEVFPEIRSLFYMDDSVRVWIKICIEHLLKDHSDKTLIALVDTVNDSKSLSAFAKKCLEIKSQLPLDKQQDMDRLNSIIAIPDCHLFLDHQMRGMVDPRISMQHAKFLELLVEKVPSEMLTFGFATIEGSPNPAQVLANIFLSRLAACCRTTPPETFINSNMFHEIHFLEEGAFQIAGNFWLKALREDKTRKEMFPLCFYNVVLSCHAYANWPIDRGLIQALFENQQLSRFVTTPQEDLFVLYKSGMNECYKIMDKHLKEACPDKKSHKSRKGGGKEPQVFNNSAEVLKKTGLLKERLKQYLRFINQLSPQDFLYAILENQEKTLSLIKDFNQERIFLYDLMRKNNNEFKSPDLPKGILPKNLVAEGDWRLDSLALVGNIERILMAISGVSAIQKYMLACATTWISEKHPVLSEEEREEILVSLIEEEEKKALAAKQSSDRYSPAQFEDEFLEEQLESVSSDEKAGSAGASSSPVRMHFSKATLATEPTQDLKTLILSHPSEVIGCLTLAIKPLLKRPIMLYPFAKELKDHSAKELKDHFFLLSQNLELMIVTGLNQQDVITPIHGAILDATICLEQFLRGCIFLQGDIPISNHRLMDLKNEIKASVKLPDALIPLIARFDKALLWTRYPHQYADQSSLFQEFHDLMTNQTQESVSGIFQKLFQTWAILGHTLFADNFQVVAERFATFETIRFPGCQQAQTADLPALQGALRSEKNTVARKYLRTAGTMFNLVNRSLQQLRNPMLTPDRLPFIRLRAILNAEKIFKQVLEAICVKKEIIFTHRHHLENYFKLLSDSIELSSREKTDLQAFNFGILHHYHSLSEERWYRCPQLTSTSSLISKTQELTGCIERSLANLLPKLIRLL